MSIHSAFGEQITFYESYSRWLLWYFQYDLITALLSPQKLMLTTQFKYASVKNPSSLLFVLWKFNEMVCIWDR